MPFSQGAITYFTGTNWTGLAPGTAGKVLQTGGAGANPSWTDAPTLKDLTITGLSGATAASRYVGATASGAPVAGTFLKGDFVVDQTGALWVCTTAGSPGTWTAAAPAADAASNILANLVFGS